MTYVGMGKKGPEEFKTLVLAQSDEEAMTKVMGKFRIWWGDDYAREDVQVYAFGSGRSVMS